MRRDFSFHTLDLSVHSDVEPFAEAFDRCYAGSFLPGRRSSMQVELRVGDDGPFPSHGVSAGGETRLCGARCYYEDGRLFGVTEDGTLAVEYELATDRLRVRLGDGYRENPHGIVIDVIRPLMQSFLLPLHGLKSLHGAVVARNGTVAFLAGDGGAGKSTTAIQAWRDGWNVLSDDGPLFALIDGHARALSSLDFVHVTDSTLTLFPELEPHRIGERDRRGKFAVDGRALATPQSRQKAVAITHYVELHRADVPSPRIQVLDRATTLRKLIAEQMFVIRSSRIRSVDPRLSQMSDWILELLSSFAHQAQSFRMLYADHHLAQLPALLETL
jgi:hypothetical protein